MSIEEIKNYIENPDPQKFISLSNTKELEIDQRIKRLKNIKMYSIQRKSRSKSAGIKRI